MSGIWLRCAALLGVCCVGLVLAGCGGGRTISTDAGSKALREAGFSDTNIQRNAEIASDLEGEIDEVDTKPFPRNLYRPVGPIPRGWLPASLDDYDSAHRAASFYKVMLFGHCHSGLSAADARRTGCPRGYGPSQVLSYRICNVTLWSYNPRRDPRLIARVRRAAMLLRADCG